MAALPHPADKIRVITIVGHVDHGKTTFVDSLLAANNIISPRMAGKIRYLDSREDEQERGITMESSAVSLRFSTSRDASPAQSYVVNLIDTPGHVDFATEVSSASRLCDGALVLLDVVEGVCSQTIAALRQTWRDGIKPVLVMNKIDRLILELKLTPLEAFRHLQRLLEQINAVIGSFVSEVRLQEDYNRHAERERRAELRTKAVEDQLDRDTLGSQESSELEDDDDDLYFAPEMGNVVFSSALHGWGFRIDDFAKLFSARLGMNARLLGKVLWGDYFFDNKSKRVIGRRHLQGRNLKPLFVQMVLENLWAVYDSVLISPDSGKISKIASSLSLSIPERELASKDSQRVLTSIFSRWLPLATTAARTIIEIIPSPATAQSVRLEKLLRERRATSFHKKAYMDVLSCNSSPDASVVCYISKMFAVPHHAAFSRSATAANDSGTEVLLGFARIFSGVIRQNMQVVTILPKYNDALSPSHPNNKDYIAICRVECLFTMMGRELVPIEEVEAGNVFAIGGLQGNVWRTATICAGASDLMKADDEGSLINIGAISTYAKPIVRVALEPERPEDMPKLVRGLKLLSQSDPCVETFQQHSGEHVILTAGEIHLERCLRDLRERFARIDINVSEPLVPFRETIVELQVPKVQEPIRHIENEHLSITVRAVPIPLPVLDLLRSCSGAMLERIRAVRTKHGSTYAQNERDPNAAEMLYYEGGDEGGAKIESEDLFWGSFQSLAKGDKIWANAKIWSLGPGGTGLNLLLDNRAKPLTVVGGPREDGFAAQVLDDVEDGIETGFQLAALQGPLCGEPLQGVAIFVDEVGIDLDSQSESVDRSSLHWACKSAIQAAIKNVLLQSPLRLMLATYKCHIQTSADVLGKVYAVVSRRRGKILAEDANEGTSLFNIQASLPVVESFGFADEIRKKTSGAAAPQLVFDGFSILDIDPFWVPTTVEELEDLGEKAERANIAKLYVDNVRERKGLFVEKKLVESAEKQRTLKR